MSCLDLNGCACTAWILACVGRVLLVSSALSLVAMPVTERLWTWDHFFRTGRDFELSMILMLTFLCLVLVLSKQGRHAIESLLFMARRLAARCKSSGSSRIYAIGAPLHESKLLLIFRSAIRNAPLRI